LPIPSAGLKDRFTVSDGTVVMDDGTGATSSLILNDVNIQTSGNVIFQSGQNRPFTLSTGNFFDVSSSAQTTVLMDSCFSLLIWTVNGNAVLGHNFNGIRGSGSEGGGDMRVTINGNLNINGGNVAFIKMANAPFDLNVIGSTTISGNPASVSFCDGNSGNVLFRTYNFTISGVMQTTCWAAMHPSSSRRELFPCWSTMISRQRRIHHDTV
jgi:hypothetical protein